MAGPGVDRREFLGLAGRGAMGVVAVGLLGCGSSENSPSARSSKDAPATRSFHSRPDLRPAVVTVTTRARDVAPGLLFLTVGWTGPLIVDNEGEPVWYQPVPGKGVGNFSVQEYRGEPVLTWWEGQNTATHGLGEYVISDASYREVRRVQAGNGYQGDLHEFVLTPRGTALFTAYAQITADLTPVGGSGPGPVEDSLFQEVDVETGRVLLEWHASQHVGLDESYAQVTAGQPFDFFHMNSIAVDHDDNLIVSARNTWTVYKIDRATGAVIWRLSGKKSDFALGEGVRFAWQHHARRRPDGTITLFDDGAAPKVHDESRGLVLQVNEAAKTATLVRQYVHPRHLLAGSRGDVQSLANGNVLIGWGALPNVSEFSAEGELRFDAHFPPNVQSYRAFRMPWQGRPTDEPSVKAERGAGGRLTVYASWNGATEVARWEVLGGTAGATLGPLASASRKGFETAIEIRSRPPRVAVRALDAFGAELGRSATVTT